LSDQLLGEPDGFRENLRSLFVAVEQNGNVGQSRILAEVLAEIAAQSKVDGLLKTVSEAACKLTAAQISCAGAGYVDGKFRVNAISHSENSHHADVEECLNCGVCLGLLDGNGQRKISDDVAPINASWEEAGRRIHKGYLNVPLKDACGRLTGSIIVMDKDRDKVFTQEDEDVLRLLSSITSLALQHIESRAAAEASGIAKDQFIANMSHELRTPMNAIMGMTDLALMESIPPVVRDYLQTAKESSSALLNLINKILDLSHIESGCFELESAAFSLRTVVEQVVKTLRLRAQEKGLGLICHLPESLPSLLVGDQVRFRQILMNLVDNAIKFTSAGNIVIRAEIVDQTSQSIHVEFFVSDAGIGIALEDQDRIFTAFAQVDSSTTRNYGGAGMGLAISRKLIERMGGKIRVESLPNYGSVFRFTIWLKRLQDSASEPDAIKRFALAPVPKRVLKVLLAEDTPTSQKVAEYLLERRGHIVEIAPDGSKALELIKQKNFDVVLMDIQMPVMDGFQATAAIRALPDSAKASVPIIAMTASTLKSDVESCFAAGMDAHISKPIHAAEFLELVEFMGEPVADSNKRRHGIELQGKDLNETVDDSRHADIPCLSAMLAFDLNEGVRRCFGKYDFFQEMVDGFLGEADALLHSMREAFRQGEVGTIRGLAHRLKNSVIYLGAQPAASAIVEVESAAKSGKLDALSVALDRLEVHLSTLKPALIAYRYQESMNAGSLLH
jgi:signal transduction histidine kinase/CheY-like chemotaxis protein